MSLGDVQSQVSELIPKYIGKRCQPYPPYSSVKNKLQISLLVQARVKGKPLFQWAREGKLNEVEIPTVEVDIKEIETLQSYELTVDEVSLEIQFCYFQGKETVCRKNSIGN